jgi:hypothetical protein
MLSGSMIHRPKGISELMVFTRQAHVHMPEKAL